MTGMGRKWRPESIISPRQGKRGCVVDGHRRGGETLGRNVHQLQKRLQAVQDAERIGGRELHAGGRDRQVIRLVFTEFLNRLARAGGFDGEVGGAILSVRHDGNAGFSRKGRQESVAGEGEPRFRVSLEDHGDVAVDEELAIAGFDVRRHGHQRRRLGVHRSEIERKQGDEEQHEAAKNASLHKGIL